MTTRIVLPHNGWKPRGYQMPAWQAIENGTRNIVLCYGRRLGKDELALNAIVIRATQRVGSYAYFLPTFAQARRVIFEAVNSVTGRTRLDDVFPRDLVKHIDKQSMKIELVNGSTILFAGSDSIDSLVGMDIVGYVSSEEALAKPEVGAFMSPMLAANSGWKIILSTPRGQNHFYTKFKMAEADPAAFAQLVTATQAGVLSPQQLGEERLNYIREHGHTLGESLYLQEYECSFSSAVLGGIWSKEITTLKADGRAGLCRHDPTRPVEVSTDLGVSDTSVFLFWQRAGRETRLIDWYAANDNGLEHFIKVMAAKEGYSYGDCYMPHDGNHRSFVTGSTPVQRAKQLGVKFKIVPNTDKMMQHSLGAQLMNRLVIHIDPTQNEMSIPDHTKQQSCEPVLELLSKYRFGYDTTRKVLSSKAIHDESSHYADAFQSYAIATANAQAYVAQPTVQSFEKPMRLSQMRQRGTGSVGAWG